MRGLQACDIIMRRGPGEQGRVKEGKDLYFNGVRPGASLQQFVVALECYWVVLGAECG